MVDDTLTKTEDLIEEIFNQIGSFGKFQKKLLFLMIFIATLPAITIYVTVFNLAEPGLICVDKTLNVTINSTDKICEIWSNLTKDMQNSYYSCSYDKKYYDKTIVTDWNLVCDRKFLSSLTQTFYLIGTVCAIFTGYFGDKFGRKRSIIGFLIVHLVVLTIGQILQSEFLKISITSKYVVYSITQVIIGTFSYCLYVSSYILTIEFTTNSKKTIFSNLHLGIYVFGEIFVLIPSYFIRNWEINNWIIIGLTIVSTILSIYFLNESPRWLISQKRFDEAEKLFEKIANTNKKSFDKNLKIKENDFKTQESDNFQDNDTNSIIREKPSMKKMLGFICCPGKNFIKLILFSCVWFSLNLLYYGVSLGITSIDSINPYLMYIFSSIAELCGYLLCIINDKIGRRKAIIIYFTLSGIICLIISFIPRNTDLTNQNKIIIDAIIIIILASIGKCLASAAFNTCYVFTAEYYPTNVRNFAFLFISCIGNIGGFISPQVNLLRTVWKSLPYIIFSSFSLFGSLAIFLLPNNKKINPLEEIQLEN